MQFIVYLAQIVCALIAVAGISSCAEMPPKPPHNTLTTCDCFNCTDHKSGTIPEMTLQQFVVNTPSWHNARGVQVGDTIALRGQIGDVEAEYMNAFTPGGLLGWDCYVIVPNSEIFVYRIGITEYLQRTVNNPLYDPTEETPVVGDTILSTYLPAIKIFNLEYYRGQPTGGSTMYVLCKD